MNDILDNFPRTLPTLVALMDEFEQSAAENPQLILRELDDQRDDDIRESVMELARDAVDYPPIHGWYQAILAMAALRYANRRIKEIENDKRDAQIFS